MDDREHDGDPDARFFQAKLILRLHDDLVLTALVVIAQIPEELVERFLRVFCNDLPIHVQGGALEFPLVPIGELDDDLDDLLGWCQCLGVVGIVLRGLARDLQRRHDEDRVWRLDVHAEGFVQRRNRPVGCLDVETKRVVARGCQ